MTGGSVQSAECERYGPALDCADLGLELRIAVALATLRQDFLDGVDEQALNAVDWRRLLDICGRHKLVPQLTDLLPELPGPVPGWVRPALRARALKNQRTAKRHIEELCRLANVLHENGVEFRVMRGPVLSVLCFGVADRREFSDLDILVARRDRLRTRHLLEQEGYHTPVRSELGAEPNRSYQMFARQANVGVDLHWSVAPAWLPIGTTFDAMARPPAWVTINDTRIPVFPKEETLVIQCIQCIKTAWVELDRWQDFAVLCAQWDDVDWHWVLRLCRKHHYLRSLSLTLHLLGPKARRHVPDSVLGQLTLDRDQRRAVELILLRLPEVEVKNRNPQGHSVQMIALGREYLPYWFYQVFRISEIQYPIATWWLMTDDLRQRWRYVLWIMRFHLSPKEADYKAVKLPRPLHGLYYLVRPVRLLAREIHGFTAKIGPGGHRRGKA